MFAEKQLTTIPGPGPFAVPERETVPTRVIRRARGIFVESFGVEFSILDAQRGEPIHTAPDQPPGNELCREVARIVAYKSAPEIVAEEGGVLALAVPLRLSRRGEGAAVGFFVRGRPESDEGLRAAAELLGLTTEDAEAWILAQEPWTPKVLERMARAAHGRLHAESDNADLRDEIERLSGHLAATYEEICLLHAMTGNLRISAGDVRLGEVVLARVRDCIPCECVAIRYMPVADENDTTYEARTQSDLIVNGRCPLDESQIERLVQNLSFDERMAPFVANRNVTERPDWPYPEVRQLIVVPLVESNNLFGWLLAINHVADGDLGTAEANLLHSLGTILGVHCGNRELYRQQREFVAAVVRTLTSAIDAKDPYTCGHSDRVARVAVRLAQQMGQDHHFLETIYMAGLLHDIGKIGVSDSVLRKPGELTAEEFEQVKKHPEIGYTILRDLRQMADCLPAVLHHHEQWNGGGYPHGLRGDEIPLIARVTAVADAHDAMHSDRPYRRGMPPEQVEEILRQGAGRQWDAEVIDAYFEAREDIREISRRERADLTLNVREWTERRTGDEARRVEA